MAEWNRWPVFTAQKRKHIPFKQPNPYGHQGKKGFNRGHGLSAAIKLGSLEKTVGASLIALWCVLSSPFL